MGLRATIQNAASSAFSALGDIPVSVTYLQVSAGGYDTTTGATTETTISNTITALITKFEEERGTAGQTQSTDRQALILGKDLDFVPKPQDRITYDSLTYEVYKVEKDPVTAIYKLSIRER